MNSWIVVAITLFFSALCSGLEIAFNSINRLQLEVELTKNTFSAKIISLFYKNQSRFITSLLLGNNIALIIYGMSMAQILDAPVNHWLQAISLDNDFMVLLVKTILATLLVLLAGEFLPKMLFRINPNVILPDLRLLLPTLSFDFGLHRHLGVHHPLYPAPEGGQGGIQVQHRRLERLHR